MQEITKAIQAFERNPSDDYAQEINLTTSLVVIKAWHALQNGADLDPQLLPVLEQAHRALNRATHPTRITTLYAEAVQRRILLLQAKYSGDRATMADIWKDVQEHGDLY